MASSVPLTEEQRAAINEHLGKLLLWIGVPNLLFIIGAFFYIFFILPDKAATEAVDKALKTTESLRVKADQHSMETIFRAGKTQATLERADRLGERIDSLEQAVAGLEKADLLKWGTVVTTLNSQPEIENVIENATKAVKLEKRLGQPLTISSCEWVALEAGKEQGAVTTCPIGKVLVGMSQTYHSGSWRNWIGSLQCCTIDLPR